VPQSQPEPETLEINLRKRGKVVGNDATSEKFRELNQKKKREKKTQNDNSDYFES
jgi:hypothetical protein